VFANKAKLVSPNYLKLVMDGERPLTDKNLLKFIRGLGLDSKEADYFKALVAYQDCKDTEEKSARMKELARIRTRHSRQALELSRDRTQILKSWHHWVIRELILLKDFNEDPAWIAGRLRNRISAKEAQESLELLQRLQFVRRQGGKLVLSEPLITTQDEVSSRLLRNIHQQLIELGIESMFNDPMEQREFGGLTIALPKSKLPKLKESIKNFRKELNKVFSDDQGNEEVYHLVIGFFPVTQKVQNT
jgi:uncharacterized protein (TIGR02147 family)